MKHWKVGIIKDTSKPDLGLHGLHTAFLGLPGVEIAALADSNPRMCEDIMKFTQAERRYYDPAEMIEREKPDIVIITSRRPSDHLPQIRMAAERGCHIYCEKPVSASLEEADEIVRIIEKSGVKLCMAHPGRYGTPYRAMKEAVKRGEIGTPLRVSTYGKCDHRGGGEDLMTLGTHLLDLMIFFFGDPVGVRAELYTGGAPALKSERTKTVEEIGPCAGEELFAEFRFVNGVRGTFESRRGLFHYDGGMQTNMGLSVTGTKGILSERFTDGLPDDPVRICRTPYPAEYGVPFELFPVQETRTVPGAVPMDDFVRTVPGIPHTQFFIGANHFAAWDLIRAIEEDRLPVSNIYNARRTLEMIYGIYASHLKAGARVEFPLRNRKHPLESEPGEESSR